jgi:hypothetical protein
VAGFENNSKNDPGPDDSDVGFAQKEEIAFKSGSTKGRFPGTLHQSITFPLSEHCSVDNDGNTKFKKYHDKTN